MAPKVMPPSLEPVVHRTVQGDVLDYVVWRTYGRQNNGLVERVLNANPGLCELGAILPVGTLITLPPVPEEKKPAKVLKRFWQ